FLYYGNKVELRFDSLLALHLFRQLFSLNDVLRNWKRLLYEPSLVFELESVLSMLPHIFHHLGSASESSIYQSTLILYELIVLRSFLEHYRNHDIFQEVLSSQ